MGGAIARKLAAAGHDVLLGSRRNGTYRDAVRHGEVVFLAIPWPHGLDAVDVLAADLAGRLLVDVSNPETEDGRGLVVGHETSGAEEIARRIPGATVVKAFSHFYAELLDRPVAFDGGIPSVLYCGDDPARKETVRSLIADCGFDPVDAGPLRIARFLEPFAMLTVQLVRERGFGPTGIAWRVMRRTADEV
jgi:8-hydroxy-5-deazaflavin:NADPH oxidoreductase